MITKNQRNSVKALKRKETRAIENRMVVEGFKGVFELLNSKVVTERIYITSGLNFPEVTNLASEKNVEVCRVSKKDMEIMSSLKNAPGLLAVGQTITTTPSDLVNLIKSSKIPTILVLDDLVDPGNVGTLIRTAHWFGLAGVMCSDRTVDIWNAKTIQASMGSVFNLPIGKGGIAEFITENKLNCAVLDAGGENIYESNVLPDAIIVGSESHGVNEAIRSLCETTWSIPGSGNVESLNAAIAGSIVSSELFRRLSSLSK